MNTLTVFAVVAAVFTSAAADKPSFCGGLDCPPYTVLEKGDGYELRDYPKAIYATTDCPTMEEAYWEDTSRSGEAFMRLFRYIQGANERSEKMAMTAPVLNIHTKDYVSMGFYLPPKVAANRPKPTDPETFTYDAPSWQVYVKSFSGFAYGPFNLWNKYKTTFDELKKILDRDGKSYNTDSFFTAGYNSPTQLFNRHNEVWLMKQ